VPILKQAQPMMDFIEGGHFPLVSLEKNTINCHLTNYSIEVLDSWCEEYLNHKSCALLYWYFVKLGLIVPNRVESTSPANEIVNFNGGFWSKENNKAQKVSTSNFVSVICSPSEFDIQSFQDSLLNSPAEEFDINIYISDNGSIPSNLPQGLPDVSNNAYILSPKR
jgi:hypothetical protein